MISKELLEIVLSDWTIFEVIGIENNELIIRGNKPNTMSFTGMESININELADMCQNKVSELEFDLFSYKGRVSKKWYTEIIKQGWINSAEIRFYYGKFEMDTLPESKIKACQWILDNQK